MGSRLFDRTQGRCTPARPLSSAWEGSSLDEKGAGLQSSLLDKAVVAGRIGGCGRRTRVFGPRELLFREHDPVRHVHVLEDGLVMLHHVFRDGRRQIVDLVGAGELCSWEAGAFHGCSAETLTSCTVTSYELPQVEASPDLQCELARRLRASVARMRDHAALLGRKTALERVASLLARLAQLRGRPAGTGPVDILLPLTRREIADHLGITQETASRGFSELRRRGVIGYDAPGAVRIEDAGALARLSGSFALQPQS